MQKPQPRFGVLAAMVFALFVVGPMAWATITDDIDPQRNTVRVTLVNPDAHADKGDVEVTVDLGNGKTATGSAPYALGPNDSTVVTVEFESEVREVLDTRIIENPDPIPK